MNIKERKSFSLNGFRGLDKEHKPSKVAPFRASDGFNFILESDTLKTRPAFKYKESFPTFLEDGDFIIDWYDYEDIRIYITKKHIYIYDGTILFDETNSTYLLTPLNLVLNFEGLNPLFQEEKDCLFIFCLNNIFVFHILRDNELNLYKYVLYELSNKPLNVFDISNYYYEKYDGLPIPYQPTLMIGDKSFEDVNLLSKTFKFQIFAQSKKTEGGISTYYLPLDYDSTINGKVSFEVEFYNNKYKNLDVYPMFLGISGEHFLDSYTNYGTLISGEIEIQDVFYPDKDFTYIRTVSGETYTDELIDGLTYLSKETFYNLRTLSGLSVFEYIMDYISNNRSVLVNNNKILSFSLPIEYIALYKDSVSDYIVKVEKKTGEKTVYIQLKFFDVSSQNFIEHAMEESAKSMVLATDPDYPSYPYGWQLADRQIDLNNGEPIYFGPYLPSDFENYAKNYLNNNKGIFINDNDNIRIALKGKFYDITTQHVDDDVDLDAINLWKYSEESTSFNWDGNPDLTGWPSYPNFLNPQNYPVIDINILSVSGQYFNFSPGTPMYNKIQSAIFNNLSNAALVEMYGKAFARVRLQTYWIERGLDYTKAISLVVPFSYVKEQDITYHVRQSFVYYVTLDIDAEIISNTLYSFDYSTQKNAFIFKMKDYFFDYNNEPSILVKINFAKATNYKLISESKFGATFGSENRLFLAGNTNYPNIDRYNVSNDLLGNNIKNQSYELTYFPSKNFRVLGGKGAINGYVIATDSSLYVTKADYPNDNKLFVRQREVNENGQVIYREFKTSINQTPLNYRCLVRFNNDILMLSKNGLYGIEISSNVLVDEKMIKLRSGLINKDIKNALSLIDSTQAYIVENNEYMYIFIGKNIYVADSRYITTSEDAYDEIYYELVKWVTPQKYILGKIDNNALLVIGENRNAFYELQNEKYDDEVSNEENKINISYDFNVLTHQNVFVVDGSLDYIFENPIAYRFALKNIYKVIGIKNTDFHIETPGEVIIDNDVAFRNIQEGETLYFLDSLGNFVAFEIENLVQGESFEYEGDMNFTSYIYKKVDDEELSISLVFEYEGITYFRLSRYEQLEVEVLTQGAEENLGAYKTRILTYFNDNDDYYFDGESGMKSFNLFKKSEVQLKWIGGITDFGNELMEKTMFRINFYMTKQQKENIIMFGYKTMKRLKTLDDSEEISISRQVDLSNAFNFDEVDFNTFALNTFNEFGFSMPLKENNFLYIQFMILAVGQVEINSIEIIYKLNRLFKSVG